MSMSQLLAQHYGTVGSEKTASAEDVALQAQYELFAKVASSNGIDLNQMSDDQVEQLFRQTFAKEASDGESSEDEKDDEKESVKARAAKELAEKKASAEFAGAADAFGRQMAHAYVDELKKVAAAVEEQEKQASGIGNFLKNKAHRAAKGADEHVKNVGGKIIGKASGTTGHNAHPGTRRAVGAGAYTAAAGAAGAAGAAAHHYKKKKEASAIDTLAADRALEIVEEFNKQAGAEGFDREEAIDRIGAVVFTLGMGESEKVASAGLDLNTAVEIRALEALEMAGYPVNWPG